MPTILIVGGYGAVGRKIARELSQSPQNHVIIAGRNLAKAEAAAAQMTATARRVDIEQAQTWDAALQEVDLVIICIDQTETLLVQEISRRGIAYLDVTAGDGFFRKAETLDLKTPAVLSVGLAPGLSNLLAASAAKDMDTISGVSIGLLMGTGDEHGSAAIEWSTQQVFDPDAPRDDAVVDFGPAFGHRKAHFMDFADQHVLARTWPGTSAITRVTYDSKILSSILFWLGRRFAGNTMMSKLVARISHLPTAGSDKCVLSVTVTGQQAGRVVSQDVWFHGRREAAVTAAVAVLIANQILAGQVPGGVHHSHMIADHDSIFKGLGDAGHGIVERGRLREAA